MTTPGIIEQLDRCLAFENELIATVGEAFYVWIADRARAAHPAPSVENEGGADLRAIIDAQAAQIAALDAFIAARAFPPVQGGADYEAKARQAIASASFALAPMKMQMLVEGVAAALAQSAADERKRCEAENTRLKAENERLADILVSLSDPAPLLGDSRRTAESLPMTQDEFSDALISHCEQQALEAVAADTAGLVRAVLSASNHTKIVAERDIAWASNAGLTTDVLALRAKNAELVAALEKIALRHEEFPEKRDGYGSMAVMIARAALAAAGHKRGEGE